MDEDRLLAQTEIESRAQQKSLILERFTNEYNQIVASANGAQRSKEALRGRRQQPDYKLLLETLTAVNNNTTPTNTINNNNSNLTVVQNMPNVIDMNPFRELIQEYLIDTNISIIDKIRTAANAMLANDYSTNTLELYLDGLVEAISLLNTDTG